MEGGRLGASRQAFDLCADGPEAARQLGGQEPLAAGRQGRDEPSRPAAGSGSTTRTSGAGRSDRGSVIERQPSAVAQQSVELFQVHHVMHAGEEQPAAAAQVPDQRMIERARVGLVAGDGRAEVAMEQRDLSR